MLPAVTAPVDPGGDRLRGVEGLVLLASLLRRGAALALLDRPLNRGLLESLLPLAATGQGPMAGRCLLEPDMASACLAADAVVLLPGWPDGLALAWTSLANRMRSGAEVFDLRPRSCLDALVASGLQAWRIGADGSPLTAVVRG